MMTDAVRRLLFPPRCAACGGLLPFCGFEKQAQRAALCPSCLSLWRSEKLATCGGCGNAVSACRCLTDVMQKAHCSDFCKPVYYLQGKKGQVQNRILYRIKNAPYRAAVAFLAEELLPFVREWQKNGERVVLMYIPRSRVAVLQSGTDQARALAEELSRQSGVDVLQAIRRRWRSNRKQKKLSPARRLQNAKQAYFLSPKFDLRGLHIILVDDIVTTGAGMAACTRLLLKAGAAQVHALAVASDDCNQNAALRQPHFSV